MDIDDALAMADSTMHCSDTVSRALGELACAVRKFRARDETSVDELPLVQSDERNRVSLSKFTDRRPKEFWSVVAKPGGEVTLIPVVILPKALVSDPPPTAGQLLEAIAEGREIERWHTWSGGGGGGWGAPHSTDPEAWATSPADQQQFGYRIQPQG